MLKLQVFITMCIVATVLVSMVAIEQAEAGFGGPNAALRARAPYSEENCAQYCKQTGHQGSKVTLRTEKRLGKCECFA